MTTLRIIWTFIMVTLLVSCSADSDILDDMSMPSAGSSDGKMTVSFSLSAENTVTKSAVVGSPSEAEKAMENYTIWVFGDGGILLKTFSKGDDLTLKEIKKQDIRVYAVANTGNTIVATSEEVLKNLLDDFYTFLGNSAPGLLPKKGYTDKTVSSAYKIDEDGNLAIVINMEQMTARIDYPEVVVLDENVTFAISNVTLSNAKGYNASQTVESGRVVYVYPNLTDDATVMEITGNFVINEEKEDKVHSFKVNMAKEGNVTSGIQANYIYKLVIKTKLPESSKPAVLWIDWYVANMLTVDVDGDVTEVINSIE